MTVPTHALEPPPKASNQAATSALIVVLVSYFMIVLDNSIIFTGLPKIQASMHLQAGTLAWVQDAYTLVFGGLLLLGGRLGDLFGRRRVFIIGLALFGLASLLVGTAQSASYLVAARAFQGIGAAIVAPSSLAIITEMFPPGPQRTRATAAYGTTAGLGASLGLLAGGALASSVSWRAGFFINVPIAAVMIFAAMQFLPVFTPERGNLDVLGSMTSTVGMGLIVYSIIEAGQSGHLSVLPLLLGAVMLGVFVTWEARARNPLMPLRVFASRVRSGAAVARLLFAGAMIGFFFFTTQWFQGLYGWNPLMAGLGFLPLTVTQLVASLAVSRLVARFGPAPVLLTGLFLVTGGMVWMAMLQAHSTYLAAMVGPLLLMGVGQGLAFGLLTSAGIAGIEPSDAGAASGVVNTAHQIGSTLGVAVLTAVGSGSRNLTGQIHAAYVAGAIMLVLALLTTALLITPTQRRTHRRAYA